MKSQFYCYSTGRVVDGKIDWSGTKSDQCNRAFLPQRWINFEVKVNKKKAFFRADNQLIVSWKTSLENVGAGGVVVKNGFMQEEAYFNNFTVE